MIIHQ